MTMAKVRAVLPVIFGIVVTWWIASPTTAQSGIPDGVFVREGDGTVWLVLNGQRVGLALWAASDDDIRALPKSDRWAVMNDDGAIVAGDRPGWYGAGASDTSAVQPIVRSPIRITSAASSSSTGSTAEPTATPTPTPAPDTSSGGSSTPPLSPGAKAPVDGKNCPSSHPIKGNKSAAGELIYHVPGGATYAATQPEECFSSRASAEDAGYRAALH
jgi:hypothetical protein